MTSRKKSGIKSADERLPQLKEVPPSERHTLFAKKLRLCCKQYDFTDASSMITEKETKRQVLLELIDYVNSKNVLNEGIYEDAIDMIKSNLFRTLPPAPRDFNDNYDPEEDEPALEQAWPHLQLCFEFFLRFIVSSDVDPKVAKRYVDKSFIVKLLNLFDSGDPRERDYLKTILHRIYGKFMSHRPFIRRSINNIFYRFIYEHEAHNGISELLEILGSIINGFALPLKEEHKNFLVKALIPLHKPNRINSFHTQLAYCVTQFVEKDPRLAEPVLRGLLKYWPVTSSSKVVLFLGELEEILELTQPAEFTAVLEPLFYRIGQCLISPHFQVSERALFLWNNEYIVQRTGENRATIFPIIFGALAENAKGHWNSTVHGLTFNVQKLLMEMDSALYDECAESYEDECTKRASLATSKASRWAELSKLGGCTDEV